MFDIELQLKAAFKANNIMQKATPGVNPLIIKELDWKLIILADFTLNLMKSNIFLKQSPAFS
jgi:hypothetical protein